MGIGGQHDYFCTRSAFLHHSLCSRIFCSFIRKRWILESKNSNNKMKPSPRWLHRNRRLKHILMLTSKSITIGSVFLKESIYVHADGGPKIVQIKAKQRFWRVLFCRFWAFKSSGASKQLFNYCSATYMVLFNISRAKHQWDLSHSNTVYNSIVLLWLCTPLTVLFWTGFNICWDAFRWVIGKIAANKAALVWNRTYFYCHCIKKKEIALLCLFFNHADIRIQAPTKELSCTILGHTAGMNPKLPI